MMKHMTCANHKQASQVCINKQCKQNCSYVCLQPNDSCRINHQSCALASLQYLLRKSSKISTKVESIQIQKMQKLVKSLKQALSSMQLFLQSFLLLSSIKQIIDPHGIFESAQKQMIYNYLNSKCKNQNQVSLIIIQKTLSNIQIDVLEYLKIVQNSKQRQQQSNIKRQSNGKSGYRSKIVNPSPVKSQLKQFSEIKQDKNIFQKIQSTPSKLKSSLKQNFDKQLVVNSKINISPSKKHVPKPPLFSKITNDIQTINTFFYFKFKQTKLLYRASQNQFSISKFHQRCDGVSNTLTLIQTEGDKIIGGFTPLPWKSAGGQWSQDESGSTFLFSLTMGQRFPLISKDKAIWCSQAYGPSFGHPDLQICDKAHLSSKSCSSFPKCFNNGNYAANPTTTQTFCGTSNGNFKIKQWQVYLLTF